MYKIIKNYVERIITLSFNSIVLTQFEIRPNFYRIIIIIREKSYGTTLWNKCIMTVKYLVLEHYGTEWRRNLGMLMRVLTQPKKRTNLLYGLC